MSTEIVSAQAAQSAMEICRNSICKGLTPAEFQYFWAVAGRKGLDPLSGEIIATKRRAKNANGEFEDRLTIQTGVDGYRHLAERTEEYDGQDEAQFDREPDGKVTHPTWATVTVYRRIGASADARRIPCTGKVYFQEFAQRNSSGQLIGQWARMPWHMLAKCAEVQAIRKAFPRQVSGLSHDAEMLGDPDAPAPTPAAAKPVAQAVAAIEAPRAAEPAMHSEWNKAVAAFSHLGKRPEDILSHLGIQGAAEFTQAHIQTLHQWYAAIEKTLIEEGEPA